MTKNFLLVVALLSLALASGCAKGGNGEVPPVPTVTVSITTPANTNPLAIYPTQTVTLTAATTNPAYAPVTWTWSGGGNITATTPPTATTSATATYVAPATAGSQPTITAALVSDHSINDPFGMSIVDITTDVAPATLNVGNGLTQQFTAVAVPDAAPQNQFLWTCTVNGVQCTNFSPAPNVLSTGLALYTAQDNCSGSCNLVISTITQLDPVGCTPNPTYCTAAKGSLVTSRVSGTYAFQFSGYDSSNNPIAVAGTFTASNGTITSGVEDEITSSGWATQSITGGSYTPTSSDPNNSNNAGTLTLTLPAGVYPNQYQVVLDGAGDLEMIESDGNGTGSGIAQQSSFKRFTGTTAQTYAFGFTGVDSNGKRVGYVGVLPMNGSGAIVGGQMDVNDNGNGSILCASPCSVTGTYSADQNISGLWHMILTSGSLNMNFDFFVASGTNSKSNPLTFYAISTGPVDNTHPAVSGTMALQDSSQTYNNAAFKGTSVSALTGVNGANTNVSLTLGTTDGKGGFSGTFDQNNAGTILSGVTFPGASQSPSPYTYAASSTPNGRYIFQMLGNPSANPVVAPLPFVLYASGQNRGFLLDQSSSSVMTGTMNPQGTTPLGGLGASELPGTFAATTTGSGSSAVSPIAANLLLTSPGGATYIVSGTQYPGAQTVTGTYTLSFTSTGTIRLTAPSAQNYVIYVLDTLGCSASRNNPNPACEIQSFLMMDEDKTNPNASIIFAQQ